jgi:hypothetical protein
MWILSYPTLWQFCSNIFSNIFSDYLAIPTYHSLVCMHTCKHPFNHRSWEEDTAYAESLGLHRLLPSVLSPSPLLQRSGDRLYRRAGGAVAPLYW